MGNKSASLMVVAAAAAVEGLECPDLNTNFGFLGNIGYGLLLLLNDLNLELGFADVVLVDGAADDDDSFEDPDSGPCAPFPVPAFNGRHFLFVLVGSCCC